MVSLNFGANLLHVDTPNSLISTMMRLSLQQQSINFYSLIFILLLLYLVGSWKMDVSNAYVEAEIDKLIHMKFPKELFCDYEGNPIIVELLKSLYGLKQAGELWNRLLNKQFCNLVYQRLAHDQCVYIKRDSSKLTVTIIVVYVIDVLFIIINFKLLTFLTI
jgi:hypothetical protein